MSPQILICFPSPTLHSAPFKIRSHPLRILFHAYKAEAKSFASQIVPWEKNLALNTLKNRELSSWRSLHESRIEWTIPTCGYIFNIPICVSFGPFRHVATPLISPLFYLNESMRSFWAQEEEVQGKRIPLANTSGGYNISMGFTVYKQRVCHKYNTSHDKGHPFSIKTHLKHDIFYNKM